MAGQAVSHSLASIHDPQSRAVCLLADAWEILRRSPFIEHQIEGRLASPPDFGPAAAEAGATAAREFLARFDALDLDALPPVLSVPLRQSRYGAQARAKAGDWYWTVIDPAGIGFYGQFLPSAYCVGWVLNMVYESLERPALADLGDLDRQLALLADLPRLIDQMTERTRGQAERGMHMPRPQIPSARSLVAAFAARSNGLARIADERFSDATRPLAAALRAETQRRIDTQLQPAFAALAAVFDAAYEAAAPEAVGMSQFEGGAEIYRELVRLHTTLDLSPEAVHAAGHARLQTIEAEMRAIRAEVGLADDPQAYLARLQADPRYRAADADGDLQVDDVQNALTWEAYSAGPYLFDPIHQHFVAGAPSCLHRLEDIAPEGFIGSEFHERFIANHGHADELDLLVTTAQGWAFLLMLVRGPGRPRFTAAEVQALQALLPFAVELLRKHSLVSAPALQPERVNDLVQRKIDVTTQCFVLRVVGADCARARGAALPAARLQQRADRRAAGHRGRHGEDSSLEHSPEAGHHQPGRTAGPVRAVHPDGRSAGPRRSPRGLPRPARARGSYVPAAVPRAGPGRPGRPARGRSRRR